MEVYTQDQFRSRSSTIYRRFLFEHLDLIFLSISTAVAVFFLFYRAGSFPPPYPWTDESAIAADALETLVKGPKLVYPTQVAGGSLAVYLEAVFIALFGKSLFGLRVLNALVNLSLIPLTYAVTRRLFASQGKLFSQLVAGLASLWLASSVWLLAMGRIAFLYFTLVAPVAVGCFYLLWRGLETGRKGYFVWSGVILGLSFHGYLPGFFLPATLVAFFILEWLISRLDKRRSMLETYWKQLLGLAGVAAVIVMPLLVYFAAHPEVLLLRPATVITQTDPLSSIGKILQNVANTLSSFGMFPRQLIPDQPELSVFDAVTGLVYDPLTALLFVVGFVVAAVRLRRPAQLFVLVWWATLLLPATLSSATVGWRLLHRGVGAEPVTFVFPALGIVSLGQWLGTARPRLAAVVAPPLVVAAFTFSAFQSYQFYFLDWANRPEVPSLFSKTPVLFAEWLEAEAAPDTVYIFPKRPGASPTARPELFTIRYLYDGAAATAYPALDEETLPGALTAACVGKSVVKVFLPNRIEVDPRGYLAFLLEQHAVHTGSQSHFDYTIETYNLKSDSESFFDPNPAITVNAEFGQTLRLLDYTLGSQSNLAAGETLGLKLRWAKLRDAKQDYSVGVWLVDANRYTVAKTDKPLLNAGQYQTTSHWAVGETATDYYSLPIPAYSPPGDYSLRVVVYTTDGERLAPTDGQVDLSLPVARVSVIPSTLPVDPASAPVDTTRKIPLTAELQIEGLDVLQPDLAHPGDHLRVSLLWQAVRTPAQNYGLVIGLIREGKPIYATPPRALISDSYPATRWRPGEILLAHYPLLLPPDLSSGEYSLALRLLDMSTGASLSDQILQPLTVEARPHVFATPHPARMLTVDFGEVVRLAGFDEPIISDSTHELEISVYWQALTGTSESYKVFAHLIDSDDRIVAQSDFIPGNGSAPTTSWIEGEIVTDTIRIELPETPQAATYRLVIGLYGSTHGARLPVVGGDGEDYLVLSAITVGK